MNEFKILTGNALEVEKELNKLSINYFVFIKGMSATNELTTIVVEITKK